MDEEGSQAVSNVDEGSAVEGSQDAYGMEESAGEDDIFKNNHDLIGV